jgi:hypothetical protein
MKFTNLKLSNIISIITLLLIISFSGFAQTDKVKVVTDESGSRLQVNGKDFLIKGMNWDFIPRGKNYTYSLWTQPEEIIKTALDREMSLLKNMRVNAIRVYVGIPPKWVQYIYEQYGIYTMINTTFGRYGVTVNGVYIQHTDYADLATRQVLIKEAKDMVEEYRNVPGILIYLLGNENNYGLFWGGAATEDIPKGETLETVRAKHMYSVFNEAIKTMKDLDTDHPISIANGDLLFIDIIADEVKNLDILGTNMYRGITFTDAFQVVKEKLGIPIMFTEFGSDAFNEVEMKEDQLMQARYDLGNWKQIYEQTSGKGLFGNSIGGFTFQFSDGWWKYDQESDLDVHNTNASWANGGYKEDFVEGENNMNEEWFGICAKGPTDQRGLYYLYPRAAYYALQKAYTLDPYAPGVDLKTIDQHFAEISLVQELLQARGDEAELKSVENSLVRVSGLRIDLQTYNTGGDRITTPTDPLPGNNTIPAFLGFDHLESFYAQVEANPAENITGKVSFNMLGHVPLNPIDEIFYEKRGVPQTIITNQGPVQTDGIDRFKVYNASITWDSRWFKLNAFYRTGHYHWGYEGDFFGLYPEANYGDNIDIYNADAPLGFEVTGKKYIDGLKVAFGPQLWWGANPAVLVKYRRQVGPFMLTGIYQDDISKQSSAVSSFAVPLPKNRKVTLAAAFDLGPFNLTAGGIWSGSTKDGESFQFVTGNEGNYQVYQDYVKSSDTFGGKLKVTYSAGILNWYAESAYMGLVADGGPSSALTFTGWRLKDCGTGNQKNFLTGFTVLFGNWQIAPNFLWQQPLVGPMPADAPAPGRPRNVLDDPFAVRANRETTAGELLITYDPTPATWMYNWDSDEREDAPLAFNVDLVFRHQPTTMDAAIGILQDGRTLFAFPGATPARDVWEINSRVVSKFLPGMGFIANLFAGTGEPNGNDSRLIHRYGGDLRFVVNSTKLIGALKFNDWGPYDYHKDFNLTFPVQIMVDLSTIAGLPKWFNLPQTRIGIRYTWRSLNEYSPRYSPVLVYNTIGELIPDPKAQGYPYGKEWEIRTYLQMSIGF